MSRDSLAKSLVYKNAAILAGISLIIFGCLVVLRPFMPALLVAAILCLSAWPAFGWLVRKLGGRTHLAATLMTTLIALCFLLPLVFLGSSLAESFGKLVTTVADELQSNAGQTPPWIANFPWGGPTLDQIWQSHVSDQKQLALTLKEYARPISQWLLHFGSGIGHGIIEVSLGIIITFFFFIRGSEAADRLGILLEKFGGPRGRHLLNLSKNTVIGVVYGILGTALVLAALATVGFLIADVPGAPFLGLLTFLLGILPGGPPFVLIPATLWLFMQGHVGMGIFLAVWSVTLIVLLDLLIRPYLISQGARMPLLLVLLGVLGGVISFGFVGLFIGPALLAIATSILIELTTAQKDQAY